MNIPFINSDKCDHDEWELRPNSNEAHNAQWHGEAVVLSRSRTWYEHCTECGERLSSIGKDAEGNVGWETLESFTIPTEVVEEYRDGSSTSD